MSSKLNSKFELGDFVFAKIRGYSPWPAMVIGYEKKKKKYAVLFFGTQERGYVTVNHLYPYNVVYKNLFCTAKKLKNARYRQAYEEIEKEMVDEVDGKSQNSIKLDEATGDVELNDDTKPVDSVDEVTGNLELDDNTMSVDPVDESVEFEETVRPAESIEIDEFSNASTEIYQRKRFSDESDEPIISSEQPDKRHESCDEINEPTQMNDELDGIDECSDEIDKTDSDETDETDECSDKKIIMRLLEDLDETDEFSDGFDESTEVSVKLNKPANKAIGDNIGAAGPSRTPSQFIAAGPSRTISLDSVISIASSAENCRQLQTRPVSKVKFERMKELLLIERRFIYNIYKLQLSLNIYYPDLEKCIKYLDSCIKGIKYNRMMLRKNIPAIKSIAKVRRYTWPFEYKNKREQNMIEKQVKEIHIKSSILWNIFKGNFQIAEDEKFDKFLDKEFKRFQISVSHLSVIDRLSLVDGVDIPVVIDDDDDE